MQIYSRAYQDWLSSENDIYDEVIKDESALGLPKDNRDSIKKLSDIQNIPAKLSSRLEDMVSFRNLLVHRYGKVDDSRAYHFLKEEIYNIS